MSREPAEIIRLLVEAFNRRDFDEAIRHMDPAVVLYPGVLAPDQDERFAGREAVMEFLIGITDVWETVTIEPQEVIEAADGRFVAVDRWVFGGRDGVEIERDLPNVFTFRDGRIVQIQGFTERAEALSAVGL